jgi:signal transduction histidine kinase
MARDKKKRSYHPTKRTSPSQNKKNIERLQKELTRLTSVLDMTYKIHEEHVLHLSNFANHDMKNALQSMDSLLYVSDPDTIKPELHDGLRTCVENLRLSFENFSKLIPFSEENTFEIDRLFIALKLISNSRIIDEKIDIEFSYPRDKMVKIPFQGTLLMLHNLIINSINSFKEIESDIKKIHLECSFNGKDCIITISDNGPEIKDIHVDKIFNYGFTTTNGSGIGLYHAKYVCESMNGSVEYDTNLKNGLKKHFIISLPINYTSDD